MPRAEPFPAADAAQAALCVLPRVGHLVNLEEPALFNTILFNFLSAVDRGRWADWSVNANVR